MVPRSGRCTSSGAGLKQLAEIAGVSSRTIQRTETAGCAAFETLRAVAAAFEADFDQLLVSETREADHPEPLQLPQAATEVAPSSQLGETLSPARPALSVRRTGRRRRLLPRHWLRQCLQGESSPTGLTRLDCVFLNPAGIRQPRQRSPDLKTCAC